MNTIAIALAGPNGTTILGDGRTVLRQFDANGRYVREIGRQPGEPVAFRTIMAAGVDTAGSITVFDIRLLRLTRFDSIGRIMSAVRVRPPETLAGVKVTGRRLVYFLIPGADRIGTSVHATIEDAGTDGGPPRRLAQVRAPARTRRGTDLAPIPLPFQARPVWDTGPSGETAYSNGSRYRIERYDASGRGHVLLTSDVAPRRVTSGERDSAYDALRRPGGRPSSSASYARQVESTMKLIPTVQPALTAVRLLPDGTLWARAAPQAGATQVRWDVFAPNSSRIGYAHLPLNSNVVDGSRTEILVTARDSLGASSATWYHVGVRAGTVAVRP